MDKILLKFTAVALFFHLLLVSLSLESVCVHMCTFCAYMPATPHTLS